MKRTILFHTIIVFIVVTLEWIIFYPHTLIWMEGVSFFSTTPDFTTLQMKLPAEIFPYCGAFLLQFFRWPIIGALILALLIWLTVIGMDLSLKMLINDKRFYWISFIPAAYLVANLATYTTLAEPLMWCTGIWILTICLLIFRKIVPLKKSEKVIKHSWVYDIAIPSIFILAAATYSVTNKENQLTEKLYHLEHLAEQKDWNTILEKVSVEESNANAYFRRYALLALYGKDELTNKMFSYGIRNGNEMIFADDEYSESQYFNTLVYETLGFDNEVIHQLFQINCTSPFGISNRAMRRLIDTFMRQGNYDLAHKYLLIMQSTPLHKRWSREKLEQLRMERAFDKQQSPYDGKIAVKLKSQNPFISDLANIMDAKSSDKRISELFLCMLLASKKTDTFWSAFKMIAPTHYPKGSNLPRIFQEVLLMLSNQQNIDINDWNIDSYVSKCYEEYDYLSNEGRIAEANRTFKNCYWANQPSN